MSKSDTEFHPTRRDLPPEEFRALLVDLDNCHLQLDSLEQTLELYAKIVICYGGAEPKVPLSIVPSLAAAVHNGRLSVVRMQKRGKNAADFGLAFWAGRLVAEMPAQTQFFIMSQDKDLDHVIHMLEDANRRVERVDRNGKQETTKATAQHAETNKALRALASDVDVGVTEYCIAHLDRERYRPGRKTTLTNSIRAFCKNRKIDVAPEDILQELISRGTVWIDAQARVMYPDSTSIEVTTPDIFAGASGLPF